MPSEAEETLRLPLRILILRHHYLLGLVMVFTSSLSFLIALTLNDITHKCIGAIMQDESEGSCATAAAESGVTFVIAALMFIILVRIIPFFMELNRDTEVEDRNQKEQVVSLANVEII